MEENQEKKPNFNGVHFMCIADKDISIGVQALLTDEQLIGFKTLLDSMTNYIVDCVDKNRQTNEDNKEG